MYSSQLLVVISMEVMPTFGRPRILGVLAVSVGGSGSSTAEEWIEPKGLTGRWFVKADQSFLGFLWAERLGGVEG